MLGVFNSVFSFLPRHNFKLIFLKSGRLDFFGNALSDFNEFDDFLIIVNQVETSSGWHSFCFTFDEFKVNQCFDTPFLLFLGQRSAFLQIRDGGEEPTVLIEHISL